MNSETNRHCSMHCYNRRYRKCRHTTVYIRPSACSPWWRVLSLLLLLFHMSKKTICTSCFKGAGCSFNYSSELLKTFWYGIFFYHMLLFIQEKFEIREVEYFIFYYHNEYFLYVFSKRFVWRSKIYKYSLKIAKIVQSPKKLKLKYLFTLFS